MPGVFLFKNPIKLNGPYFHPDFVKKPKKTSAFLHLPVGTPMLLSTLEINN